MNNPEKRALEYFNGDYNCTQAVLRTVLEEKGFFFEEAPAIAAAFGGGIIGRGEVCGAVSGALMAIGVLSSKLFNNITEQKKVIREYSEIFYNKFENIFGHNTCNGLIGIDRNDPLAKQKATDAGIYKEKCPKFVIQATNIVLEIFKDKF
ncbi:MAG TPA: C-GCAxxG-C-C family protein [candidate division Zixibacteria bacterium]|nr:C-GCAxxG-C-C family protein [candidate division Zixibacteria bacterium]